jgi:hypothetical protein
MFPGQCGDHGLGRPLIRPHALQAFRTEEDRKHKMNSTTTGRLEIAEAQAFPLLGLVNYQEGSVVSRVILKRDKGNVTVFAFDEG